MADDVEWPHEDLKYMDRSLDGELDAVWRDQRFKSLKSKLVRLVEQADGGAHLYATKLDLSDDKELTAMDGMEIRVRYTDPSLWLRGTLLSSDRTSGDIVFELDTALPEERRKDSFQVLTTEDDFIKMAREKLGLLKFRPDAFGLKVLDPDFLPTEVKCDPFTRKTDLDEYQRAFVELGLRYDLTLGWGPPGTGKTHAAAQLLAELGLRGKRVLAVATANTAVDELAGRLVGALDGAGKQGEDLLDRGYIMRFGHPRKPEVRNESRLFPHIEANRIIREELDETVQAIERLPRSKFVHRAKLQKKAKSLRKLLRQTTIAQVQASLIVITTLVQPLITEEFAETPFDVVLIDEASQVSIPHALVMSMFTRDKHIVVGDPRQLPPIAVSGGYLSTTWLQRNLFDLIPTDHPSYLMLRRQRRMHPTIAELINPHFYEGKLISDTPKEKLWATELPPLPGVPAVLIHRNEVTGCPVETTSTSSRLNRGSAATAMTILKRVYPSLPEDASVALIAAYRAHIRHLIRSIEEDPELRDDLGRRIRVGTVHVAQATEADIVIWDHVDVSLGRLGRLSFGKAADRIGNVAISRARGKLIILADNDAVRGHTARSLLEKLYRVFLDGFSKEKGNIITIAELPEALESKKKESLP